VESKVADKIEGTNRQRRMTEAENRRQDCERQRQDTVLSPVYGTKPRGRSFSLPIGEGFSVPEQQKERYKIMEYLHRPIDFGVSNRLIERIIIMIFRR